MSNAKDNQSKLTDLPILLSPSGGNDSTALQALANACAASGEPMVVQPGTYTLGATLVLNCIGDLSACTFNVASSTVTPAIRGGRDHEWAYATERHPAPAQAREHHQAHHGLGGPGRGHRVCRPLPVRGLRAAGAGLRGGRDLRWLQQRLRLQHGAPGASIATAAPCRCASPDVVRCSSASSVVCSLSFRARTSRASSL
jgi:hypothetical protein